MPMSCVFYSSLAALYKVLGATRITGKTLWRACREQNLIVFREKTEKKLLKSIRVLAFHIVQVLCLQKYKKKIQEIKDWEGSKGTPNCRVHYRKLKKELLDLMEIATNELYLIVSDYVLEKQWNPKLNKFLVAIYTKEGFEKKELYLNQWKP